jgi:hypothetical protein
LNHVHVRRRLLFDRHNRSVGIGSSARGLLATGGIAWLATTFIVSTSVASASQTEGPTSSPVSSQSCQVASGNGQCAIATTSGSAIPNTSPNTCNGGGATTTCFQIFGTGLYVSEFLETSTVLLPGYYVLEISGPSGFFNKADAWTDSSPTQFDFYLWPERDMPAGTYCGSTWQSNDLGQALALLSSACNTVHA